MVAEVLIQHYSFVMHYFLLSYLIMTDHVSVTKMLLEPKHWKRWRSLSRSQRAKCGKGAVMLSIPCRVTWLIQPQLTKQIETEPDPLKTRPAMTEKYRLTAPCIFHVRGPCLSCWELEMKSLRVCAPQAPIVHPWRFAVCPSLFVLWQFIDWMLINAISCFPGPSHHLCLNGIWGFSWPLF